MRSLTNEEIKAALTPSDWSNLAQTGRVSEQIVADAIDELNEFHEIRATAKKIAAINKFGVNSPEYVALLEDEKKEFKRVKR